MQYYTEMDSPAGRLRVTVNEQQAVTRIQFIEDDTPKPEGAELNMDCCTPVIAQLLEYFAGQRRKFDLRLAPEGTEFQRLAWDTLLAIPYGKTITYAEQAEKMGRPRAVRAVGSANGKNPIPIVIPCHRVVGANGSLGGYSSGLEHKRALLELEGSLTGLLSLDG